MFCLEYKINKTVTFTPKDKQNKTNKNNIKYKHKVLSKKSCTWNIDSDH